MTSFMRLASIGGATIFLLVASFEGGGPQQPMWTIELGQDQLLSSDTASFAVTEPSVSSNPTKPDQLFVSAIVPKSVDPYDFDCALFASSDGGQSWTRTNMGFGICGNTWSVVLPDGTALFVALTEPGGILKYHANMRVYRSADGGITWPTPPHDFGRGFDYPKIAYDTVQGDLYVVGAYVIGAGEETHSSIVVARSTDGGRTFSDTVRLTPSKNVYEAQVPAILSDGTLLVPFTEHHDADGKPLPARRCSVLVSRDRGHTFSRPRLIANGGCGGSAGWPYLATDATRDRHRDRLYWLAAREGQPGVWLRYSDSVGLTWSHWVRVDREVAPSSAVTYALAVNRAGTIGVMWLSRTQSPSLCTRLFFSASVDGGDSFLQPVRVSSEPSCPARDRRNAPAYAYRSTAGGDYNALAAAADGSFHLVWADARDGVYRLRHATVLVKRP